MTNIQLITLEKYNDSSKFEKVSDGIFKALIEYEDGLVKKGHYVTAISFTLEQELDEIEHRQYPLEDVLDRFYAHVSEFVQDEKDNPVMKLELCTQEWLDKMQELVKIANKHIFNRKIVKDGKTYVELVIE